MSCEIKGVTRQAEKKRENDGGPSLRLLLYLPLHSRSPFFFSALPLLVDSFMTVESLDRFVISVSSFSGLARQAGSHGFK